MLAGRRGTLPLARSFAGAACAYWLEVFPCVNRELARWRERARSIPDPCLRELALATQQGERGNLEGAAAFAVLVPRERREPVIRAAVCFQALYDYLDTLAEQPAENPVERARSLHEGLVSALDPVRPAGSAADEDDYVSDLVAETRAATARLPSWDATRTEAIAAAERMIVYQSLVHGGTGPSREGLEAWAASLMPSGCDAAWWEAAAGAASSLGVFALLAAAARPGFGREEAANMHAAYFPWIGALHVLLDSLVDRVADEDSGHLSLVAEYESPEQMATRLAVIARRARTCAAHAGQDGRHLLILAAMASFYLSRQAARAPQVRPAREAVLTAIGAPARPAMALLRARGAAPRLAAASRGAMHVATAGSAARLIAVTRTHVNSSLGPVTRNSSI